VQVVFAVGGGAQAKVGGKLGMKANILIVDGK
jgi:hypothetical protein